jgi:hypothetical protein
LILAQGKQGCFDGLRRDFATEAQKHRKEFDDFTTLLTQ